MLLTVSGGSRCRALCTVEILGGGLQQALDPDVQRGWQHCFNAVQAPCNHPKRFLPMSGTLRQNCGSSKKPIAEFPAQATDRKGILPANKPAGL